MQKLELGFKLKKTGTVFTMFSSYTDILTIKVNL
jgi:hypothetical protein